jgi:DNA invertase Pin-like site-specific DNA recombinase
MEKKVRTAIYCRVSTQEQKTDLQRDELIEFVEGRGWSIFKIYEDKATGTNSNRVELQQLLKDARQRKFDVVCVWKLDRFFRSLKELLTTIAELQSLRIEFVALKDQIDLTTPAGRLLLQILGSLSEFSASLTKERVLSGLAAARRRGVRLGRPPEIDDVKVHALRAKGMSYSQISSELKISKASVHKSLKKVSLQVPETTGVKK